MNKKPKQNPVIVNASLTLMTSNVELSWRENEAEHIDVGDEPAIFIPDLERFLAAVRERRGRP